MILFRFLIFIVICLCAGCSLSPVPEDMDSRLQQVRQIVPALSKNLKEGDIIFRLGETQLLGGALNFSKLVADATESNFSHAVLVYRIVEDGVVLADITPTGIARRYISDWYMDGTTNIVVKRLKPEFATYIPSVLNCLKTRIEEQVLYDSKFNANDNKYYCTELVDDCFRKVELPLADKIRICDFPKYNWVFWLGCLIGGIDTNSEVVVVGNDKIGLFSSNKLYTVIDLRNKDGGGI